MNKYYLLLAGAIACEVIGTTCMKASNGFADPFMTIVFIIGYIGCFTLLTLALKGLPLGVAYGVWSGLGVAATAVIGVLAFGDPMNWVIVAGIVLIIGGVVLLETSQPKEKAQNGKSSNAK